MDRMILLTLGAWGLLTGVLAVTNIDIVFARPMTGVAALACGILCLIRAFR